MIAGVHAACLLFHNHAVDLIRSQNPSIPDNEAYLQARRLTVWHYQWMILHEFLPHIVGQPVIDDVLANGRHFYNPIHDEAFIPGRISESSTDFGTVWCGLHTAPISMAITDNHSLLWFSTRLNKPPPTLWTCVASQELRGALSAGRLSSISAALTVPMYARTKESIQRF